MSVNQRAAEIKQLIEANAMTRQIIISQLKQPHRQREEIERLQKRVAKDMEEIARLEDVLANGPQKLRDIEKRMSTLRKELKLVNNSKTIERLLKLVDRTKELN